VTDKRHPDTSYAAQYPYNRVTVTESGHEIHLDDTPHAERIRIAHKDGSYVEWTHDGRRTDMTVANSHAYVKGGHTLTVDKNLDEKVGGSIRSSVGGDVHAEIAGENTSMTQGDSRHVIGGDHVHAVQGDSVSGVVGNTVIRVGKGFQIKGDGMMDSKIDGATNVEFGSTLYLLAHDAITFESKKSITLRVGSSSLTLMDGKIVIKSATNVLDASDKNEMGASNMNIITSDAGTQLEATLVPPAGKTVDD